MSSQTKLIKDIMSLYDTILENKNVSEAIDVYDNVNFENIGLGNPASDEINITLLQDVQTAAKMAGLNVDITTAVSGHGKGTRHEAGNAVDVARINGIGSGKATNSTNGNAEFRKLGDKLKDALVSMGYVQNVSEKEGPDKVVLWQTNLGGNHFNHIHISNTTNQSSSEPTSDNDDDDEQVGSFVKDIGKSLLNAIGINEEKTYSSFGKNYTIRHGKVYTTVGDKWVKVDNPKKLTENIDRIKGLLK
jgi:hypothetical protein